jgi:FkbM family methyltransferase
VSEVRGGEAIRRVAGKIRKFKGRDFVLWNIASLLNRSWPHDFPFTDSRGLRFTLDLNDASYRALYLFGQYEWDLLWTLENLLDEGDTFLEAGTSIGVYTALASRKVGRSGKVIGFEPLNSVRETAERQLATNGLTNVTIAPYALGTTPGTAEIFAFSGLPNTHASLSNLAPAGVGQVCEVTTLDSFLGENRGTISLIKLDVEGSELPALKGARETMLASHPKAIVEANPETAAAFGYSFRELQAWFDDLSYDGFVWESGRWRRIDRGFENTRSRNVLFVWRSDEAALRKIRSHSVQ